jgi:transposase-like protein
VLEAYVSKHRDKKAALRFLKKLLKRHGRPEELVTDGLRSYGAALNDLGAEDVQVTGRWESNRAENSHQPFRRRERAMDRCSLLERLFSRSPGAPLGLARGGHDPAPGRWKGRARMALRR